MDSPPRTRCWTCCSPRYGCIVAACGDDDGVLQHWKLSDSSSCRRAFPLQEGSEGAVGQVGCTLTPHICNSCDRVATCCMLEIWLDYYREDFCQLPEFPSLRKLLEFLRQHMPGSDVELRARHYLQQFRRLHAAEPEAGCEEDWGWPSWEQALRPEQNTLKQLGSPPQLRLGPAAPWGPEGIEAVLAAGAEGLARAEVPAGEAKPLQIVVTALVHCSTLVVPPAPLGALEDEQAPPIALEVVDVPDLLT
ncbi:Ral guanine nucleotide dissociation stimulator-like 1 [Vulpes lagopus]